MEIRLKTSQGQVITAEMNAGGGLSGSVLPSGVSEKSVLQIQGKVRVFPDRWETELCIDISDYREKPDWFPAWEMQITRGRTISYPFVIGKHDFFGREMNLYYCVVRPLSGASDQKDYYIRKQTNPISLSDGWDSPVWKEVPSLSLRYEHWKPGLSGDFHSESLRKNAVQSGYPFHHLQSGGSIHPRKIQKRSGNGLF